MLDFEEEKVGQIDAPTEPTEDILYFTVSKNAPAWIDKPFICACGKIVSLDSSKRDTTISAEPGKTTIFDEYFCNFCERHLATRKRIWLEGNEKSDI